MGSAVTSRYGLLSRDAVVLDSENSDWTGSSVPTLLRVGTCEAWDQIACLFGQDPSPSPPCSGTRAQLDVGGQIGVCNFSPCLFTGCPGR